MPSTNPPTPPQSPPRETLPRFAIVMAALLALAAFPQSSLFTVERIDVDGANTLTPGSVGGIAGLRRGERLFAVDSSAALQRLRADPRIKTAEVRLRPPNTVFIVITERRPVVALAVGAGFALLAEDLVVVALSDDAGGLPVVVDHVAGVAWARPGAPAASEGARLAVAALPVIPPALRGDLRRIVVAPGGDFTIVLRTGLEVRAGGSAGLADRLAQVPQILDALRAKGLGASSLDLRYAGSVVIRPSSGGEAR